MTRNLTNPDLKLSISTALVKIRQRLNGLTATPRLDSRVLLAHICAQDMSWLSAHPEADLTPEQIKKLDEALKKLVSGMPLPYVIGEWEFYALTFVLTPDVLIPRPETELLVETALEWLTNNPGKRRVLEAGTGSGCIAVSLAVNHSELAITATDISVSALAVAMENARRHNVFNQIKFIEKDLLGGITGQFDLICANLPYIPTEDLQQLDVYRREPTLALDGGPDGLNLIRRLLDQAVGLLANEGLILLEVEDRQGEQVLNLAQVRFPDAKIKVKPDLAGKPRLLVVER